MKTTASENRVTHEVDAEESWLELVRRQVKSLAYGTVHLVVHESRVVQIERTEKVRLTHPVPGSL